VGRRSAGERRETCHIELGKPTHWTWRCLLGPVYCFVAQVVSPQGHFIAYETAAFVQWFIRDGLDRTPRVEQLHGALVEELLADGVGSCNRPRRLVVAVPI
jgi:hypothetical protein